MQITVNGQIEQVNKKNLLDFLNDKNVKLDTIVIEYNYEVIKRDKWSNITLNEGDNLEIISFVGGG